MRIASPQDSPDDLAAAHGDGAALGVADLGVGFVAETVEERGQVLGRDTALEIEPHLRLATSDQFTPVAGIAGRRAWRRGRVRG